jgi:hypothetical protein
MDADQNNPKSLLLIGVNLRLSAAGLQHFFQTAA